MAIRGSTLPAQADWSPDARGQAVLAAIIKEHLRTGEPVASRTISERVAGGAGWSSATIRNVMAELEDHGLVEQPHTSAGRVPTDKGYRFYVDHFVGDARLSRADISAIDRTLGLAGDAAAGPHPSRLMEKVSHALSEMSENVGIVVSPPVADSRLEHVEFLQLSDGRILVVLVFASNLVQNKIIRIDEPLTQDDLERAARYLNAEFGGKSLQAIRSELLALMGEEKALYDRLLRNAVLLFERGVEGGEDETGEVYIDGASNILAKPDFADVERLRELFRTFEAKSRLVKILNECGLQRRTRRHRPRAQRAAVAVVRAHHRALQFGRGLRRGHGGRRRPDANRVRAHHRGRQLHRSRRRARTARGGSRLNE